MTTINHQMKKSIVIPKGNFINKEIKQSTSSTILSHYSTNSIVNIKPSSLGKSKGIYNKPLSKRGENDENINTQNLQIPKYNIKDKHSIKSGSTNISSNYQTLNNSNKRSHISLDLNDRKEKMKSQSKERTGNSSFRGSLPVDNDKAKNIKLDILSKKRKENSLSKNIKENITRTRISINLNNDNTQLNSNTEIKDNTEDISNSSINIKNFKINKEFSNDFTPEDYKKFESLYVRENHNIDVLNSLLKEEQAKPYSLANHKINERMRMRMVDWMIEVINNYKCDESVFFLAIDLMDSYFELNPKSLDPNELHLIGVASMFTASKYQDIYPLRLKMVHEKIAHKKLTIDEIKQKEAEIVALKEFKIGAPTVWDFILLYIEEVFINEDNNYHIEANRLKEKSKNFNIINNKLSALFKKSYQKEGKDFSAIFKSYTPNMINLLKHVALYLAKMNLHDYTITVDNKPSLIAASTVFVSLKICEQINKTEYLTDCFIKKLVDLSRNSESSIIKIAQKILNNAQNFDTIFNGLENLKRVHFNAIIELKHTK